MCLWYNWYNWPNWPISSMTQGKLNYFDTHTCYPVFLCELTFESPHADTRCTRTDQLTHYHVGEEGRCSLSLWSSSRQVYEKFKWCKPITMQTCHTSARPFALKPQSCNTIYLKVQVNLNWSKDSTFTEQIRSFWFSNSIELFSSLWPCFPPLE